MSSLINSKRRLVGLIVLMEAFKFIFFRWRGYSLLWYSIPVMSGVGVGLVLFYLIGSKRCLDFVKTYATTLFVVVWTITEIGMNKACVFSAEVLDTARYEYCFRLGQLSRTFLVTVILIMVLKVPAWDIQSKREGIQVNKGLFFKVSKNWGLIYFIFLFA